MRKLIFIFLILAAMAVNSQVIGKLTVGKLYAKDTVVMLSKGLKFADGTYLISANGIGDTIMTLTTSGGHGFVYPKYNTYPYISTDSGFAMMNRIFVKMGGTKASNKHSYYIGENTPLSSCIGQYNSVIGYYAGASMADANHNNIMGYYAGASLYDGDGNTFIGNNTGYLTEAGTYNVFIGQNSGYSNVNGNYNVFLGYQSGRYLTAPSNWIIFNTKDLSNALSDTTRSPLAIWQHDSTKYTRIYANGNLYISDTLFYSDGTYSVTVPAGGGGLTWSDTSVIASKTFVAGKYATLAGLASYYLRSDTASVLASKTFTAGKYATLSGLSVYCLKSDTASLLASKTFTAGKYATLSGLTSYALKSDTASLLGSKTFIAGKYATLAGLVLKMTISDTATLWASKAWANGRFALLGSSGGSSNWKDTLTATIVPITNKSVYTKIMTSGRYKSANTNFVFSNSPVTSSGSNNFIALTGRFDGNDLTGSNNIIIGDGAGRATGNSDNIFLGEYSGYGANSTTFNVAIGAYSIGSGTSFSGGNNTAIGRTTLYNCTGDGNTALGAYAGKYLTSENNRIFINSLDRTNKAGDTTLSPVYIYQAPTTLGQILYMNGIVKLPVTADPPTVNVQEGMIYCDTDHHIYYYNGSSWVQLDN